MTFDLILALIAYAVVSSITPGPNNLMLLASGANFGLIRSLPHMFGISIGHSVMVFLVGMGLKQVFDAYPVSYTVLKTLSIAYLLFLAWKIASNRTPPNQTSGTAKPFSFLQAAAFQWVNPKAVYMAFTAVTVYAPASATTVQIAMVAIIFAVVNFPSVTVWVILGQQMSRFLHTPRRLKIFNITAGLLLVATLYPIITR